MLFRLTIVELIRLRTQWKNYIPGILASLMTLFVIHMGLGKVIGDESARSFSIGWLQTVMINAALAVTITTIVDIGISRSSYYYSLPMNSWQISISHILKGIVVSICGTSSVLIVAAFAGIINIGTLLFMPLFTTWQSIAIMGIMVSMSRIFRKLDQFVVFAGITVPLLQYFSPAYFPIENYPIYVRYLMYVNPVTSSINLSRSILLGNPVDFLDVTLFLVFPFVFGFMALWTLVWHIEAKSKRLEKIIFSR